jgi:hypothetical protein
VEIRSIEDADGSAVIGINTASVWATSPMDESGLDRARKSMWPTGSCLEFWATLDVIGPTAGLREAHRV